MSDEARSGVPREEAFSSLGPCRDLGPKVERRAFTCVIKTPWCFPDISNELPGDRLSVITLGPEHGTDAQSLNLAVTAIYTK